jgi:Protein of unknown function (DUF3306)
MATTGDDGFLNRWARRKSQSKRGQPEAEPAAKPQLPVGAEAPPTTPRAERAAPAAPLAETATPSVAAPAPAPTLADVAALTKESDFSRFVTAGVDDNVKRAALKKLFADPHFNLMDGLDTYIDDYNTPNPIPAAMLRQMAQSKFLGLFADEPATQPLSSVEAAEPAVPAKALDENPDLQLQPDDAAGRPGAGEGAEPGPPGQPGEYGNRAER